MWLVDVVIVYLYIVSSLDEFSHIYSYHSITMYKLMHKCYVTSQSRFFVANQVVPKIMTEWVEIEIEIHLYVKNY